MIRTPAPTRSSATRCAPSGRHREHADDDVLLADGCGKPRVVDHVHRSHRSSDLVRVDVEDRRDVDPVLGEDRRAGDRLSQTPGADECDVVLPLRAKNLPDLPEQRVDVVTDASLAELPERREISPDLGRVDVRVVGDLLRGDPLLAHLLRLRQHLQVAREASRNADGQPISHFVTPRAMMPAASLRAVGEPSARTLCDFSTQGSGIDEVDEGPLARRSRRPATTRGAPLRVRRRRRCRPRRSRPRAQRAAPLAPFRRAGSPRAWKRRRYGYMPRVTVASATR